jgi:DDE domain
VASKERLGSRQGFFAGNRGRDHRPRSFPPLWRLRGVAARGFCSCDLSHSRHTMTIAAMAGASCAGLPVHSRHAATAGACALTLSVFASLGFAPRHALSTLFAKISQQVFDFFEFVLVQTRRNKRAALKLMRKLLKKYGFVPDKLVTDDLRSYGAAASDLGISKRHERGRWRNNRAENSHQPTRRRERKMQRREDSARTKKVRSTVKNCT